MKIFCKEPFKKVSQWVGLKSIESFLYKCETHKWALFLNANLKGTGKNEGIMRLNFSGAKADDVTLTYGKSYCTP